MLHYFQVIASQYLQTPNIVSSTHNALLTDALAAISMSGFVAGNHTQTLTQSMHL